MKLQENIQRIKSIINESEDFTSKEVKKKRGVLFHNLITIDPFVNPQDKRKVKLKPFHLIVGENSGTIFDVFNTDEIAGLKKEDYLEFIEKNKSEKNNGFIAGLTNVYEGQTFLFINNERFNGLEKEGLISHECLHLTRYLITFLDNSDIDFKDKTWWEKTKFTDIKDNNEELFAETLERCVDVVFTKLKKYI